MDDLDVKRKFGDNYCVDEHTFVLGINFRFSMHIASRFENKNTLETCSGAGFSTISLAKYSKNVISIEIDENHLSQAKKNVRKAGYLDNVEFLHGNALDEKYFSKFTNINAAFLDPDWAVKSEKHKFKFINSNTEPPADFLFKFISRITNNIALILPPKICESELNNLPPHECEKLYLNGIHALYCLYFGELAKLIGKTKFEIID